MSPRGLRHRLPVAEGLQAELEHPVGLALLLRDEAHHLLVKTFFNDVGMHVGGKAVFIFLFGHLAYIGIFYLFLFHVLLDVVGALTVCFAHFGDRTLTPNFKMQNYEISIDYSNVLHIFCFLMGRSLLSCCLSCL